MQGTSPTPPSAPAPQTPPQDMMLQGQAPPTDMGVQNLTDQQIMQVIEIIRNDPQLMQMLLEGQGQAPQQPMVTQNVPLNGKTVKVVM